MQQTIDRNVYVVVQDAPLSIVYSCTYHMTGGEWWADPTMGYSALRVFKYFNEQIYIYAVRADR